MSLSIIVYFDLHVCIKVLLDFISFVTLQKFCGASALTQENCPRRLMEEVPVICAGRVKDSDDTLKTSITTHFLTLFIELHVFFLNCFFSFTTQLHSSCFILKCLFLLWTVLFGEVAREWYLAAVRPGWFVSVWWCLEQPGSKGPSVQGEAAAWRGWVNAFHCFCFYFIFYITLSIGNCTIIQY